MILADKIITLRKRAGWSQEELAAQLHVTRQSVSKWEGAQSTPDLEKLVQMSRLFGVSADLLLKDELELPAPDAPTDLPAPADASAPPRRITLEDAEAYLALRAAAGPKMAAATFLMVLAPVPLLLLAGLSDLTSAPISENAAAGLGLCILLLLAAAGVGLFLSSGSGSRAFAYLEDEAIAPAPGVNEFVEERRAAQSASYTRRNTLGVLLCILSVLPLFGALCFENAEFLLVCAVCLLLVTAGIGCALFVLAGTYHAALDRLQERGDYTRARKATGKLTGTIAAGYWLVATGVYLLITFSPAVPVGPENSWLLWPIAGVLFAALMPAVRLLLARKVRH